MQARRCAWRRRLDTHERREEIDSYQIVDHEDSGWGGDTEIHAEVLSDADATSGGGIADTKFLKEVLDEIRVGLSQQLTDAPTGLATVLPLTEKRQVVALGEDGGAPSGALKSGGDSEGGSGGGGLSDEDALQARLDALRRG
ncbi:hypothetical protein EW146_g7857 [Bondarzewia mesenterica]|uniref:Uncharacterized protein n=1 Tax=Bondarzewia mesenterica TaxID=1095465 RepID=A0A4S4LJG7_9AGAM|nr:hypothetical protein EW146_g7857 [Bondarzewia mesenterica]